MKTIGIDGNEANIENRVGVNMYAFELLCSIYKVMPEWKDKFNVIVYLKNKPLPDLPAPAENWHYKVMPGKGLWIVTKLTPHLLLNPQRLNLFFFAIALHSTSCPNAKSMLNYGPRISRIFGPI